MLRTVMLMVLLFPMCEAGDGLPFRKDLAGDRALPLPFGISIDYYTMDQPYRVDSLGLSLPNFQVDPSLIGVENEIQYLDIKFDVWILPFLNAFAIVGQLDGETDVDFAPLQLPLPLGKVQVDYDGFTYGAGLVFAIGGDQWFGSLTTTFTDSNLSGDFDSSVSAFTAQPKLGWSFEFVDVWAGAMYLSADEEHKGTIDIQPLGPVGFEVSLSEDQSWNGNAGLQFKFSPSWQLIVEAGFGDRDTLLANIGYRF
ncbi:MAG: hypothetical protein KDC35_01725 [Acidobacteria bacterium]|nr:hypothetical protein [Acidobacteriota bacterium]